MSAPETSRSADDGRYLRATRRPLAEEYDVALLDLDGVVYVGPGAVPHASEALTAARDAGMRTAFVTNNASRTADEIAAHLRELGVDATAADVVTSAQAAAHLLADELPAGSAVLVVGGRGLEEALRERGLRPVRHMDDEPAAVVQGFAPTVDWAMLAEGSYAVEAGLPWVATNLDPTFPSARGLAPGNGTLVAAIATATGAQPRVAGKPKPPLHRETIERTAARAPLVVGDRLDTDIEGATTTGTDSLLLFTGVTTGLELALAPREHRPTYLAVDLRGLLQPAPAVEVVEGGARCGSWTARVGDGGRVDLVQEQRGEVTDDGSGDTSADNGSGDASTDDGSRGEHSRLRVPIDAVRALAVLAWSRADAGQALDRDDLARLLGEDVA